MSVSAVDVEHAAILDGMRNLCRRMIMACNALSTVASHETEFALLEIRSQMEAVLIRTASQGTGIAQPVAPRMYPLFGHRSALHRFCRYDAPKLIAACGSAARMALKEVETALEMSPYASMPGVRMFLMCLGKTKKVYKH